MRGYARRSASGRLNSSRSETSRGWPSPVYVTLETARHGGGRGWGDEKVANRIPSAVIQSADEELHPACHSGARGIGGGRRSNPPGGRGDRPVQRACRARSLRLEEIGRASCRERV